MKKALHYLFYAWVVLMITIIAVSSASLLFAVLTNQIH
jgi:hypothetical protein